MLVRKNPLDLHIIQARLFFHQGDGEPCVLRNMLTFYGVKGILLHSDLDPYCHTRILQVGDVGAGVVLGGPECGF